MTQLGVCAALLACPLVALAGCGDEGSGCRTNGDCRGELECQVADPPRVCGIPCAVSCAADTDCPDDTVCMATAGAPCCDPASGSFATECRPMCTLGSCPEGTECVEGKCRVPPCDECPEYFVCRTDRANDAFDGCVRVAWRTDADCAEGVCVQGTCWDEPGRCETVTLAP